MKTPKLLLLSTSAILLLGFSLTLFRKQDHASLIIELDGIVIRNIDRGTDLDNIRIHIFGTDPVDTRACEYQYDEWSCFIGTLPPGGSTKFKTVSEARLVNIEVTRDVDSDGKYPR